ncbi:MAG: biotin/lipoyl-binding protein [Burkholderiales bacterium]|nr:biotin/lipoyl-binding protein [Burkholderiales bacterium]MDR4516573.1 biotin/lipoyl-binding protein [Nitrosomonas sp.]
MLKNWSIGDGRALIKYITKETAFQPTEEDVSALIEFLHQNQLTVQSHTQQSLKYLSQHKKHIASRWYRYLNNYLFFRVPLFRPDLFLDKTYPAIKKLCTPLTFYILVLTGVMGSYLVSRQWDEFLNTFLHFFTFKGALLYAIALIFTKTLHELGHAYTAKHYGCRVPSMGVAFMVMMPVLYSDMTDTWRLCSKKQRIHIAAAGMINELLLAGICLFLWSFLPDGVLRSICFITATTSLVSSLIINITPFMRFDGYFILSDWWGIDNLQQRSFRLAQWKTRQFLFGSLEEKPEYFLPGMELKLICYAWLTWLYRLVLFLGIALLVYHFFFKLLGILLFFVEIILLILMPIYKEIKHWWLLRKKIHQNGRLWIWGACLLGSIGLLFYPWSSNIHIPGVLTSSSYASIYASEPGQILTIDVQLGQDVEKDQILMTLESPELEYEIKQTRNQLAYFKLRAMRAVTNQRDKDDLNVIMEQIAAESSRLEGLLKSKNNLILRAPFSGKIAEMDETIHVHQWVNDAMPLFFIMEPGMPEIKGIAFEHDIDRIESGQEAAFYPEDPLLPKLTASIHRVDWGNIKNLELTYLASTYGGKVAVKHHSNGAIVPEITAYAIRLNNVTTNVIGQEIRGIISIKAEPVSIAERVHDLVLSVIIRESGF